jgi:hypothetical protein
MRLQIDVVNAFRARGGLLDDFAEVELDSSESHASKQLSCRFVVLACEPGVAQQRCDGRTIRLDGRLAQHDGVVAGDPRCANTACGRIEAMFNHNR